MNDSPLTIDRCWPEYKYAFPDLFISEETFQFFFVYMNRDISSYIFKTLKRL